MRRMAGLVVALTATLGAAPAPAQDGVELQLAIVAADDRLRGLDEGAGAAERAAIEEDLARLCAQTDFADVATCVDIARNERWLEQPAGRGCVITVGRAWGCSTATLRGLASSGGPTP